MNIFLPFKPDRNPYLDEIINHSRYTYFYGHFEDFNPTFNIVNIHWPEAIFDWYEPTVAQLDKLENHISHWKKSAYIIYTKHDEVRHKAMTPAFQRLFNMIEESSDIFIHLGDFSKNLYKNKYPAAKHYVAEHPLYKSSFTVFSKEEARKMLGISESAFVITAPGKIRNKKERWLLLRAFKKLQIPEKVLISTNMRVDQEINFPGRVRLKKFLDIKKILENKFVEKYHPPKYLFTYNPLSKRDFALRVAAADLLFIPRINILNSGNIFLGLTFRKIMVGPASGNIKEQLLNLKMPVFNPTCLKSAVSSIEKGKGLHDRSYYPEESLLRQFEPELISEKIDAIFEIAGQ